MTNENAIGGTALANPTAPGSGLKHSLRSATRAKEEELEEATLIREEEKVMDEDDEEITSEEDGETAEGAEKVERTMLTAALVNSSVEGRKLSDDSGDPTDPSKHRYGLRKRRRQSGEDLKRLEHFQSTTEGGLARVPKRSEPEPSDEPDPKRVAPSEEPDHDGDDGDKSEPLETSPPSFLDDPKVKMELEDPNVITKLDDPIVTAEPDPPPTVPTVIPKLEADETRVTAKSDQPTATAATPNQPEATVAKLEVPAATSAKLEVPAATAVKPYQHAATAAQPGEPVAPAATPERPTAAATLEQPAATLEQPAATPEEPVATPEQPVAPAATPEQPVAPAATPEQPVAPAATPEQPTATPEQPTATRKESDTSRDCFPQSLSVSNSAVPDPLNRPIHPPSSLLPDAEPNIVVSSFVPTDPIFPPDVPCPLPTAAFEEKVDSPYDKEMYLAPERKFSINESIRSRGFSNDTDSKDMYGPPESDRRKVTINESVRSRGFSIDMDSILDMPDDSSAAHGHSDIGGPRDRAFSFECFAFGINIDEPLPPLEQSASSSHGADQESFSGRPRGDSIIFDPVSFQDGGIHEQTALERTRSQSLDFPEPAPLGLAQHPGAPVMQTPALVPSLSKVVPYPVASANPVVRPTMATSTNITTTISTSAGTSTGSFSLDLLNKDGRIGIYLPDARRARIARFHAKRAKRIWRKRIKYDCRKKLADSRPRIKGRFVKRSDMDDEVQ